jgi:DNA-nicking Smr family endonuclease
LSEASADDPPWLDDEPVVLPITGELDLHTFKPSDLGDLLPDYLDECRKAGIFRVRVIHGKGSGTLREGVHRLLERLSGIAGMEWPASAATGGWGATWVLLKPE